MRFRVHPFALGLGCLALLQAARSDDKPVDPSLLEFLGSVDTEDKDWHEYLAHTDIEQVAKRAGRSHGGPAPPTDPTPTVATPTASKNPGPVNPPAPSSQSPVSQP